VTQGVMKAKGIHIRDGDSGQTTLASSARCDVTSTHTINLNKCVPNLLVRRIVNVSLAPNILKHIELNMVGKHMLTIGFNKDNSKNSLNHHLNNSVANPIKPHHRKAKGTKLEKCCFT